FWNTVAIKHVNDVTRLQTLVDKKKVVVTKAEIRELLIRKQVGDLLTHTTKYASPTLTQKVFANMRRVGKWFYGVDIPLFEGMLVGQEIKEGGDEKEHVEDVTAGDAAQGDDTAAHGEVPTVQHTLPQSPQAQPQPQTQPQQAADFPMSLLQEALDAYATLTKRRIDTSDDTVMDDESNQGMIIDKMDKDDAIVLMDDKEDDKKDEEAKEDEPTEVQEVVDVVTTAKLITEVVTAASETVTATNKGKGIMVEEPKPLKKKQQIEMDEEYARKLHAEINKDID
nr:hypothetical protein [Tanacetum cinerariifolium]